MGFSTVIRGRVWVFADDVDTDQILPGHSMSKPPEELGKYAMSGSAIPDFPTKVKCGDIIVAGFNFGMGSSREQAPVALKQCGVALVIAKSFARIFRRNAINIGLPVMVADTTGLQNGDEIEVNLRTGSIRRLSDDWCVTGIPVSAVALETLEAGGLIEKVKRQVCGNEGRGLCSAGKDHKDH
ncbi:MAG TPA: 3-isopropylmalate dehydratase [Firmicutes bacterium]|nr:3-isopropylmalate dehydratase [Bacillota bacterium]